MRPIKFRAWGVDSKEFVQESFSITSDGKIIGFSEDEAYDIPGEYILMQFTGLLDKNGKEIWEGDVFAVIYSDVAYMLGYKGKSKKGRGVVEFKVGAFWLKHNHPDYGETSSLLYKFLENPKEVIGNIYENPDLLQA